MDRFGRRPLWTSFAAGVAVGVGLHTLFITTVGLFPQGGDSLRLWTMWLVFASAVPVFVIVVAGLVLAPLRARRGRLGTGMVVGAVASPLLWVAGATAFHDGW